VWIQPWNTLVVVVHHYIDHKCTLEH
jgi:hypothetical protein